MHQLVEHQGILIEFNVDYKFKAFTEAQDIDLDMDLEKAEESEIKLPASAGSLKKQKFQKNIYFCFIDYAKAQSMWITINCGKF